MKNPLNTKVETIFASTFKTSEHLSSMRRGESRWDSLKHMDLIVSLETCFEITMTMDEIVEIRDFDSAVLVISEHLAKRAGV